MKTQKTSPITKLFNIAVTLLIITAFLFSMAYYISISGILYAFIPPGTIYNPYDIMVLPVTHEVIPQPRTHSPIVNYFHAEFIEGRTRSHNSQRFRTSISRETRYVLIDSMEINLSELLMENNAYSNVVGMSMVRTSNVNIATSQLPSHNELLFAPMIEPYVFNTTTEGHGLVFSFVYPQLSRKIAWESLNEYQSPNQIYYDFIDSLHESHAFWAPVAGIYATLPNLTADGSYFISESYFSIVDHAKFYVLPAGTEIQVYFWFHLPPSHYKFTTEDLMVILNIYKIL